MQIPYIDIREAHGSFQASAGFALKLLDSEQLRKPADQFLDRDSRMREAHHSNVRLLQHIAQWKQHFAIELHLTSHPSLDRSRPGKIQIALQIQAVAEQHLTAAELCLSHCVLLQTLLPASWPAAEFSAIATGEEFGTCFRPFQAKTCLQIDRRQQQICLARPFALASRTVGFQSWEREAPARRESTVMHTFPWAPTPDDWHTLTQTLLAYPTPVAIIVRMTNDAVIAEEVVRLEETIRDCEQFLAAAPADQVTLGTQLQQIRDTSLLQVSRLNEGALRGSVLMFSPGLLDEVMGGVLGQAISGDLTRGVTSGAFSGGFLVRRHKADDVDHLHEKVGRLLSCEEAACAFRLPLAFSEELCGLPVRRNRHVAALLPPANGDAAGLTVIGVNRTRGSERTIAVTVDHLLQHVVVLGQTGTGKSTFELSLLMQHLRNGHGACLIDPHGDLADQLLARLPPEREKDLIVMDMADRKHPIPLNLLWWRTEEERDLIIDELLSQIQRIYRDPGMTGPIYERHFRNMLRLLMGDKPSQGNPYTLLEFSRLYQNPAFRGHLLKAVNDEQVHDFVHEMEKITYGDYRADNIAPYITAKFGRFLQDSLLQLVLGHGRMALDFQGIMNRGGVLIVKLARGQFGANVADLLTAQIVSRFRIAAMSRAEIPEDQRKPFFLFVDEAGSLAKDESFAQLLSEARKYKLGLVIGTQYASQLRDSEYSRNVLSAILGNVGTIVSYRIGVEDAALLGPVFAPVITQRDLIECPNYQGYMRLHGKVSTRPFSFHNLPDATPPDDDRARKLVQSSRRRWGVSAEECRQKAEARGRAIKALGSS